MRLNFQKVVVIAAMAVLVGAQSCSAEEPASSTAVKAEVLTEKSFPEAIAKGVVLVDFWATWCPPCKRQGPIVDAVAKAMAGKARVTKLDVDNAKKVSQEYKIKSIPTLIIFKDGKPVKRFVGLTSEDKLVKALKDHLK